MLGVDFGGKVAPQAPLKAIEIAAHELVHEGVDEIGARQERVVIELIERRQLCNDSVLAVEARQVRLFVRAATKDAHRLHELQPLLNVAAAHGINVGWRGATVRLVHAEALRHMNGKDFQELGIVSSLERARLLAYVDRELR